MGLHSLRQLFETHSIALATVEIAHLATLKNYYMRFLSLTSAKLDAETGLRNPTILEAQAADRQLTSLVGDSVAERSWTYDDALYEITHVRAELHTLLQPRPRLPKQPPTNVPVRFEGKGDHFHPYSKGKGNKGAGRGPPKGGKPSGKVAWVTEAVVSGERKALCMRFQLGRCNLGSSCRFHHGCAYPLSSGEECGKNHGAVQHERTPH